MLREEFEHVMQEVFDTLPEKFRTTFENVRIVVEDVPVETTRRRFSTRGGSMLLGLYEGIPLNKRGADYGVYPVVPDTITLFQKNIEAVSRSEEEVRGRIREVLIHEIGHYFGMTDAEIRKAGY